MINIIIGAIIGFVVCAFVYANNNKQATKIVDALNVEIKDLKGKVEELLNKKK